MFEIRPFDSSDADYQALVAVNNAVWPDEPTTVELARFRDSIWDPQYLFQRILIVVGGQVVGVGAYLEPIWSYKPAKYFLELDLLPEQRRQGIGTASMEYMLAQLAAREPQPQMLMSATREDQGGALKFLEKHGFQQFMRYPVSHLTVEKFDFAAFADAEKRVNRAGIEICTLAELKKRDSDWIRKLWDLIWEIDQDIPSADPPVREPLELFAKFTERPGYLPHGSFVALDGGQLVGFSNLKKVDALPHKLNTGVTGVARSHRRRGVATALKVRAFRFAKSYGATLIATDNEENNPMYQINLRFGFEPQPAWLDFEREA